MADYQLRFYGRKISAIGISYHHTITVSSAAESKAEVALMAYDTHEHIHGPIHVRQLPDGNWESVRP